MLVGCDAKLMADHYVQGPCSSSNLSCHGIMTHRRASRVDHVLCILREKGLRLYKVQVVHELRPGDRTAHLCFYRWMLHKIRRNRHFLKNIVFTDESSFSTSILNRQNVRIWRRRNPHAIVQRVQQGRFSVNVWAYSGMIILLLCFSQTDCQALSICGFYVILS